MSAIGHESALKGSRFFKSGEAFTLSEAWSTLFAVKGGNMLSQSRVEEVLSAMVREGVLDKVGDKQYRAQSQVKRFLHRKWRKNTDASLGIEL